MNTWQSIPACAWTNPLSNRTTEELLPVCTHSQHGTLMITCTIKNVLNRSHKESQRTCSATALSIGSVCTFCLSDFLQQDQFRVCQLAQTKNTPLLTLTLNPWFNSNELSAIHVKMLLTYLSFAREQKKKMSI